MKRDFKAGLIFSTMRILSVSMFALLMAFSAACSGKEQAHNGEEAEPESRTEFTDRVENFFEYAPLKAGRESRFLIHLTDLSDGTPVEKADVMLTIRKQGGGVEIGQTKTKIGRVTGIYVADVTIPDSGVYDIEFHIKNNKLDERMPLKDFEVE
ncbi:MAG: FixH family protein [Blastocatellia bacterium]|nr:FixH family protein [Blastocatellia bacterium]